MECGCEMKMQQGYPHEMEGYRYVLDHEIQVYGCVRVIVLDHVIACVSLRMVRIQKREKVSLNDVISNLNLFSSVFQKIILIQNQIEMNHIQMKRNTHTQHMLHTRHVHRHTYDGMGKSGQGMT